MATDPYGNVAHAAMHWEAEEVPHTVGNKTLLVEEQLGEALVALEWPLDENWEKLWPEDEDWFGPDRPLLATDDVCNRTARDGGTCGQAASEEGGEAAFEESGWATCGWAVSKEGGETTFEVGGQATHESGGWATIEEAGGQVTGMSNTGQTPVSDRVEPMVLGEWSLTHHLLEDIGEEQHTDLFMGAILWFLEEDVLPEDDAVAW